MFERTVLGGLFKAQIEFESRGIELAIGKPVFDRLTDLGPCRPDFVIKARSKRTGEIKRIIMEAMESADEVQPAAKAVMHSRMRSLGTILTITPDEMERFPTFFSMDWKCRRANQDITSSIYNPH